MNLSEDRLALVSGDISVDLSRLEFRVVRHLWANRGAIVPWDDLIFAVYNANEPEGAQKSIIVTMHNLKAKLAREELETPVVVKKGVGLMVEA